MSVIGFPSIDWKRIAQAVPPSLGTAIAFIPFSWRPGIGTLYARRTREISEFQQASATERRRWILERVQRVVAFAVENVPFYREYYHECGFAPSQLREFDDLASIPIVTRAMLQSDMARRCCHRKGAFHANTGGTSGKPLDFLMEPSAYPHEYAHMHAAWRSVGFRPHDLGLTLVGRNNARLRFGSPASDGSESGCVKYDGARHMYAIDIYRPLATTIDALRRLGCDRFRYLHGYPSTLLDFTLFCEAEAPDVIKKLRRRLKCVLLSSEFPAPAYRDAIERVFQVPTQSWYGHSERAAFACEHGSRNVYSVFQTYGFAEAVNSGDSGHRLIATNYYNFASPFIRYDTEDLIEPLDAPDGVLTAMAIRGGRVGEFIRDSRLQPIQLTGLFFGRHHALYGTAKFIQVAQDRPGKATLFFVPRDGQVCSARWVKEHFDSAGVGIEFTFRVIQQPFRTASGKVPLVIPITALEQVIPDVADSETVSNGPMVGGETSALCSG